MLQGPPERPGFELEPRQRLVAVLVAAVMLALVIELVRRRKLREEYSVVWVLTAIGLLVLAFNYRVLIALTDLIGAKQAPSTLFFGGLVFVMLVCLMLSVRMTRLSQRQRILSQKIAILEEEMRGRGLDAPADTPIPDRPAGRSGTEG